MSQFLGSRARHLKERTRKRTSKRRGKKTSLKNNARKRKGNQKNRQGYLISVLEDVSDKLVGGAADMKLLEVAGLGGEGGGLV